MNTKGNKNRIILIAVIMAIMVTALFLVVNITPLFITAYAFALISIAAFCFGNLYLIESSRSYPWFAAFPIRVWQYLITELVMSAVFVIIENLFKWSLPVQWLIFIHIILLGVFSIPLVLMKSGKEIIDARGEVVKQKVTTQRFMQADIESLIRKFPEHDNDLRKVADALRYSDPMSHSSLAAYEEQIQRKIILIDDGENIPEKCDELLRLIADRNSRVKITKN